MPRRALWSLWIVGPALGLSVSGGCRSPLADDTYDDWVRRDPATWTLPGSDTAHRGDSLSAGPAEQGGAALLQLPAGAGPEDYVALALQRSPAIRRAEQKVLRLSEVAPQMRSLEDPMFSVSPVGEMAETAEGMVGLMTMVSQELPTPGKLRTRGRIAEREAAMAAQELADVRLEVAADTRTAYWSYAYASRALGVVQQQRGLLEQFRDSADAVYRAGGAAQADVLRAAVEISDLDRELLMFQQRRISAAAMLNRLLDRPIDAALPEPAPGVPAEFDLELDTLLARAAVQNPKLREVRERIAMYRQRRKLADLERWPDLTVGVNYSAVEAEGRAMSATGQDQWWLTFGINLPIWQQKRDAAEREALHGIFEGAAELTDQQNQLAFRITDALARVESRRRQAALFRDVIIPQARQAVDASAASYRAGRVEFLMLLDTWRQLLAFELMAHETETELARDLADLQREVGGELPENGRRLRLSAKPQAAINSEPTQEQSHASRR